MYFKIENIIDYTSAEDEGIFLEGTGSLLLDRVNSKAYCALSPRADEDLFIGACDNGFEIDLKDFNNLKKNDVVFSESKGSRVFKLISKKDNHWVVGDMFTKKFDIITESDTFRVVKTENKPKPISLLNLLGKVMERCVHKYTFNFLLQNNY